MENQTLINYQTPPFGKQMLSFVPSFGIQVFVNDMACISNEWKQYRFPKSKKVRIRKKWSKRRVNFRMQEVHKVIMLKAENKMYVSQKTFDKLKELPQAYKITFSGLATGGGTRLAPKPCYAFGRLFENEI